MDVISLFNIWRAVVLYRASHRRSCSLVFRKALRAQAQCISINERCSSSAVQNCATQSRCTSRSLCQPSMDLFARSRSTSRVPSSLSRQMRAAGDSNETRSSALAEIVASSRFASVASSNTVEICFLALNFSSSVLSSASSASTGVSAS